MKYIFLFLTILFIGCANDTGMSVEENNVNEVATNINYTKYSNVSLYDNITIENIYFTDQCEEWDFGGNVYPCVTFYNNSNKEYNLKIQYTDYCNDKQRITTDYLDIKAFSYTNIHSLTCWDPKTYKIIITTLSAKENYNWNVIWTGRVELDYRNFN